MGSERNISPTVRIVQSVEKYFGLILVLAVAAGLLPNAGDMSVAIPYLRFLVMLLLFMMFLKIDVIDIFRHLKNMKLIGYVSVAFLILTPLAMYFLLRPFSEVLALGVLILTAAPAGTAAPVITDLLKGNTVLAASITIVTSLVAPFTIPLVVGAVVGQSVVLHQGELFLSLALTIFVPLLAAQLMRHFGKRSATYLLPRATAINVIILFFLVYFIELIFTDPQTALIQGAIVFGLIAGLHVIGYYVAPWLGVKDRLALASSRAYMNDAIAIVIAASFFQPEVLLVIVLAGVSLGLIPGLFKTITQRTTTKKLDKPANVEA